VVPLIEAMEDDISWKVRRGLVKRFASIYSDVPEPIALKTLLPLFANLLVDQEPEVRIAACYELLKVGRVCKNQANFAAVVGPQLIRVAQDTTAGVRLALSSNVIALCGFFPKEAAVKMLLPVIQKITTDDVVTVRAMCVKKLSTLDEKKDKTVFSHVLPYVLNLTKDPKWRVRVSVIEHASMLAAYMGAKTFEKKLLTLIIVSLSDHVYRIREVACEQVGKIITLFGGDWVSEKLLPSAFTIYDKSANYFHRMTCLQLIMACAEDKNLSPALVEKHFLPIITQACTDDVANVRIACAHTVRALAGVASKTFATRVSPLLQTMSVDADVDVAFFAAEALNALGS
jgi:hypothetical protein